MIDPKKKKFFHQRFPLIDRLIHFGERPYERYNRHMELENPEEYKAKRECQAAHWAKVRRAGGITP